MSKLSIYETKWTDLVFENKNKEYGAYQLRQESSKNSITALFMGLLIIGALGSASVILNKFKAPPIEEPVVFSVPIKPTDLHPNVLKPDEPKPIVQQPKTAASAPVTSAQLVHPVIVPTAQALPDVATNTNNTPAIDNTNIGNGSAVNVLPTTGGGGGDAVEPIIDNTPVLAAALDKLPEFPGGINKFYTYVGNNFNRPELDSEKTLKVYVSFVIEKDGSLTDILVIKDPGFGMGKEAIRVLKSLKIKWAPGMLNGKAVRTAYNLPITIKTEVE